MRVRQASVFSGRRGQSKARANAFLLLQHPTDVDGVDQLFGFDGKWLSEQVADSMDLDDSQLGKAIATSDILVH